MEKKKTALNWQRLVKVLLYILLFVFLAAGFIFGYTGFFVRENFPEATFDQLIYNLHQPVETADPAIIKNIFDWCIAYPLQIAIVTFLLLCALLQTRLFKEKLPRTLLTMGLCAAFSAGCWQLISGAKIDDWIEALPYQGTLYEDHYTDPAQVEFTFPEQKRNLIYIYLESMETSYADIENGGALEDNLIPELTEIAQENLTFSDKGMTIVPALNWTMTSLTAQTAGVNMKSYRMQEEFKEDEKILPGAYTLGDVLDAAGYNQVFIMGSDADFASRSTYFQDHGHYELQDVKWAREQGLIPEDYHENWGYEDEKVFDFAKTALEDLTAQEEPFNLTILTADTHFYNGYLCEDCPDTYDIQYENVIACSDHRVAAFVAWCQEQDWYENTTIVLAGDHQTMDTILDPLMEEGYKRGVYVTILNSAKEPVRTDERQFCAVDMYPTTLSAMGVEFDSPSLGLGVDLFSAQDTLLERMDSAQMLSSQMFGTSTFYLNKLMLNK